MYVGSSDAAILNGMATASPLNANLSSSWVWNADPKTDDPYFEEMAAQGQSFFQASGDGGKWGPLYPSEDDYITSVGGTDLITQGAGGPWESETAWSGSGGGIASSQFQIPYWQVATAAGCSECSQTNRNGPDVAANANTTFYYCSDQSGCGTGLGGTSFAAPMWAGYMALVNEQAAANGHPTLGFINPAVYSIGLGPNYDNDFHDITSGCQEQGSYCATVGYDLATGWGSPNDSGLINALAQPFFTLTPNPYQLTVQAGNNGTSTITVVPASGFTGSVTLSASGLPSGVTAGFNPNPTTTTSTLTLTVGASVAPGTYTIFISGTSGSLSTETGIQLKVTASGPVIGFNPTSLTFGKTKVGKTSAPKTVTVSNTGGSTLDISSIATSGDFARKAGPKKTDCGSTLAAGATCTVRVVFKPTQTGTRTGDLIFTDNAAGSPQQVPLTGTGK
jgi:subtilase family serine protease